MYLWNARRKMEQNPEMMIQKSRPGVSFWLRLKKKTSCPPCLAALLPDQGGEDFFFWTNGSGIKWGDNVKFQYDPNEKKRLTRHRRKAFSISVVRVMDRQGTAVPRGDSRGVINQQRPVAAVMRIVCETNANSLVCLIITGPIVSGALLLLNYLWVLKWLRYCVSWRRISADMRLKMDMLERRQSESLGGSN